jgi:DNA polymerase III subunit delta'
MKTNPFANITGQHTAKTLLTQALKQNKITSAYLFTSAIKGVGKGKTARAFARAIVRENHQDILFVEPTYLKNSQTVGSLSIRVEQVSEIIEFLSTVGLGSRKVVIIKDAEHLNSTAANKLLKTLEEPKTGTFILTSSQPQKLLPTITSRCQIIPFTRLTDEEVVSVLQKQQIQLTQELLAISSGSPGQAIINQCMFSNISSSVMKQLEKSPENIIDALGLSNCISNWGCEAQLWLLNYLQHNWWKKFNNTQLLAKFTQARQQLSYHVTPRSVWDNLLLP